MVRLGWGHKVVGAGQVRLAWVRLGWGRLGWVAGSG